MNARWRDAVRVSPVPEVRDIDIAINATPLGLRGRLFLHYREIGLVAAVESLGGANLACGRAKSSQR